MTKCYHFENIENQNGIMDNIVDATYIIHLENNDRLENINQQLKRCAISKKIHILFNKGTTCDKNIKVHVPPTDLVDAFYQCFKHAKQNSYNNILILEDDFIFDDKINDVSHIENIRDFFERNEHKPISYRIGCVPLIKFPCDMTFKHYHGVFSGTHAVIYNKPFCDMLLNIDSNEINDWDVFNNNLYAYTYYTPLCYQLFPDTVNSYYWGFDSYIRRFIGILIYSLFQLFGLNKSIEPGYPFFYMFSNITFLLIFGLLIYLGFILIKLLFCLSKKKCKYFPF